MTREIFEKIPSLLAGLINKDAAILLASPKHEYRSLPISSSISQDFFVFGKNAVEKYTTSLDTQYKVLTHGYKPDQETIEYKFVLDAAQFNAVISGLPVLDDIRTYKTDELSFNKQISYYVIYIGGKTPILFFRKKNPQFNIKQGMLVRFFDVESSFTKIDEPTMAFDSMIDCIYYGGYMYIINKSNTEQIFKYREANQDYAAKLLDEINLLITIENLEELKKDCSNHINMLRKINGIAETKSWESLTLEGVQSVISNNSLALTIRVDGGKLVLGRSPGSTNKWEILNLLDDAYLHSLLTGKNYEVNSKYLIAHT